MDATFLHNGALTSLPSDLWCSTITNLGFTAVIFDCDGTLVDSAEAHLKCMQAAAREQGQAMARDWYQTRAGLDRRSLFQAFRQTQAPDLDIAMACRASIARFDDYVHLVQPIPETLGLVCRLREQGLPLAVATNAERPIAQRSLGAIGAQNLFETLVSITDDVPPKPAPLMFQKAAQHLGHTGRNVLVIEDSEQGVLAAQDAGMSVICLTR